MTPGPTSRPAGPDVSVRPAVEPDAPLLAAIQLAAWQERGLLSAEHREQVDDAAVSEQWHTAITRPPSAGHRVITAMAGPDVVGFLAFAPAELPADLPAGTVDPQPAEIITLEVTKDRTRAGHGARLLAACADLAREAGYDGLVTWSSRDDEARTRFLTSAGFAPAGLRRTLTTGAADEVVENLWRATL